MSQTLVRNFIHIIYSTKGRVPSIARHLSNPLYAYKAGVCRKIDCTPIKIGGYRDHVHLLINLSKNHALKEVVGVIKSNSTNWLKKEGNLNMFNWQDGYAAYSVGERGIEPVKEYIDRQEEHHASLKVDFKVELIQLLNENGVEYDERHLWT